MRKRFFFCSLIIDLKYIDLLVIKVFVLHMSWFNGSVWVKNQKKVIYIRIKCFELLIFDGLLCTKGLRIHRRIIEVECLKTKSYTGDGFYRLGDYTMKLILFKNVQGIVESCFSEWFDSRCGGTRREIYINGN